MVASAGRTCHGANVVTDEGPPPGSCNSHHPHDIAQFAPSTRYLQVPIGETAYFRFSGTVFWRAQGKRNNKCNFVVQKVFLMLLGPVALQPTLHLHAAAVVLLLLDCMDCCCWIVCLLLLLDHMPAGEEQVAITLLVRQPHVLGQLAVDHT